MDAVLLVGHGGFEMLEYRVDVPVPVPGVGEVLIRVAAAGVNNTDINTRLGWYSKSVREQTAAGAEDAFGAADRDDAGWSGRSLVFPRIQGADCCGRIVAVGSGVPATRVGERVMVRTLMANPADSSGFACWTYGSDCDGGFAQFSVVPSSEAYRVECGWSDVELASLPCAYSTAEGMLERAAVAGGEHVLITGASGGVGSAAVQLAKRRGAHITAVAAAAKADEIRALGADRVVGRGPGLIETVGREQVEVVVDVVAGPAWPELLELLRRGGRLVTAGAIGGPIVELDVRTLYLKDLTLLGCTAQGREIFENLVRYVERGEIRPHVSQTYPLAEIVEAQKDFLAKKYTGKLVLVTP